MHCGSIDGGRQWTTRILSTLALFVFFVQLSTSAGATARSELKPCELLKPTEIAHVFGVEVVIFHALSDSATQCTWVRPPRSAELTNFILSVGISEKVPKKALRGGERYEESRPAAEVVKGVGDFAVYRPEKEGKGGSTSTTRRLLVAEGTTVFTIRATGEIAPPTRNQLVGLARMVLERL